MTWYPPRRSSPGRSPVRRLGARLLWSSRRRWACVSGAGPRAVPGSPTSDGSPSRKSRSRPRIGGTGPVLLPSALSSPEIARAGRWVAQPDRSPSSWPRLEESGLRTPPRPIAPTLLGRLTFDLTGLPPTPEELRRLPRRLRRPTPSSASVDRLLASVRLRRALLLALARPGPLRRTPMGFEYDQARPTPGAIATGSSRRPEPTTCRYDEFVRRQLAGDEIDPDDSPVVRGDRLQPLLSRHGRPATTRS